MPMTYTSLIAAKGTAGSIANWVNYTKLDVSTILDEAQALIYSQLRTREMRSQRLFALTAGASKISLPTGFLDPIGRIRIPTMNYSFPQKDQSYVAASRSYSTSSGLLGTDALTTTSGSASVDVALTGHGFYQGAIFKPAGAAAFNGVTITGAFPVVAIIDADNFTIDIGALDGLPTASGAGGGAAMTYSCDNIQQGTPLCWGIWDETIYFDQAISQDVTATLNYFRSLPLLSASNPSNFLTNRYPQIVRTACQTAAADFMKDDGEYQKGGSRLMALIQSINAENDGFMRGMEIETENP
jgi:hypothetical protein